MRIAVTHFEWMELYALANECTSFITGALRFDEGRWMKGVRSIMGDAKVDALLKSGEIGELIVFEESPT